jgi:prophage antirepressor-like protein
MSSIQLFNNGEFELRVSPDGDTFTVEAPGLASALGHREAYDLIRSLPDDETWSAPVRVRSANGVEQNRRIWIVTEPGFYRALGQRQVSRIKDPAARAQVERFQNWIYREVLPSIRRTGRYEQVMDEPLTHTWDEVTTIIRQRYGVVVSVATLTRMLRTAGILRQTGVPKKAHQHFFWFTGTAWEIHPHAIPFLTRTFEDTARQLQEFRFMQTRLELDGVGQRHEISK